MIDFQQFLVWLEAREKLAGWGQMAAGVVTLAAMYVTASMPIWAQQRARRKRKAALDAYGERLLREALVSIISFCRRAENDIEALRHLEAFTFSLRQSAFELQRFPVAELEDQDDHSLAAALSTMASMMGATLEIAPLIAANIAAADDEVAYHQHISSGLAGRRRQAEAMAGQIGLTIPPR